MTKKLRIGLVFGGRSGEHEVSLVSARSILDALDRDRYEPVLIGIARDGSWHIGDTSPALLEARGQPLALDEASPAVAVTPGVDSEPLATAPIDVFFPVLHGTYGEDGTIQGLLEMAGVPYVGSGVLGSAVGMDKDIAKRLLRDANIPVVEFITARARQPRAPLAAQIEAELGYPCFVKPANMGSSVGVHKVAGPEGLDDALDDAFAFDRKVLIERAVDAREIECSVLGNEAPRASVPGEIVPTDEFYSYKAKYVDENGAALIIPADIDAETTERVRELSIRAFETLELCGMARVDFLLDRSSGSLYINEVNTIPGFTQISMYPKLWEASGVSYAALVDRLIELALERHRERQALSTRYLPG